MSISMQNIGFITQLILEILQKTLHIYFEYIWHIWPHSSKIIVSFNKKNCDAHCNKNLHTSLLAWDIAEFLQLWVIWAGIAWPCSPRLMVSTCIIFWHFICMQKNHSFPSFLRYCKDITNLLFWVCWTFLAMTSKNITTSLQKSLMLLIVIPALFLEILQTYCKLIILGTFGNLGHAKQKQYDQTVENSYVYMQINFIPQWLLQMLHFVGSHNLWLAKNILRNNSWIKILPDMDFFAVFSFPRWTFILIFFPLFSPFPLD